MKRSLIIANWKSNKTSLEVKEWTEKVELQEDKEVIVCPSSIHLSIFKEEIERKNLAIQIGAQDISACGEGVFTGEVNGTQLKEFVLFVIVGHSERRKMGEDKNTIRHKIEEAFRFGITPIFCISKIEQLDEFPFETKTQQRIIAYEPLFAIGSGKPDTAENAQNIAKEIKKRIENSFVLYGGSVTSNNVNSFTLQEDIDGVLVGKSSLDPMEFSLLVQNA